MKIIKKFFSEFGFEPEFNNAVLFRLKSKNFLLKLIFGVSRLLGRIPFKIFKNQFYPEVNSRIVEISFVLQNIPDNKNLKIMDFGCAESALPLQLASLGYHVTGFDLQDYGFKHPNFHFVKGDFLKNKTVDSLFDIAVAISSVEHAGLGSYDSPVFSGGDIKIIEEIHKKLKNNGKLIITLPFGKKFKDKFMRRYDYHSLQNLLKGFKIIKEEYYIRNKEKTIWTECSREMAKNTGQENGPHDGLVCLVCKK